MARDHRRLAAIVSADVVGYSRLMGRDDLGTLTRLKALRREVIDPKIVEFGGRIVNTAGDNQLLEFPSVVDAVRCSVDVQHRMAERNDGVPSDQRIDFRIGINVGDIIVDGDNIYGDGVNVAARLEALAEPGGICVSKVVRDQVRDKLSFAFEDLGAQEVKNIARPVEVYRVNLGSTALQPPSRSRKRWERLTRALGWQWLPAGVVALALAGIAVWALPQFRKAAAPAFVPPPYSVVVLPFASPGGNPADEQFADSLTNDLTMALGRVRVAHVVSHSLAVTYKGKAIDARTVGRELNVRYLVQGEVLRSGERIMVNAQLIDTTNATQLWSDRLEVEPAQTASDPAGLVARLTRRVRDAENGVEFRRASGPLPPGASARDLELHAVAVYYKDPCAGAECVKAILEARKMADEALRLDPNLVQAMILRAVTLDDQLGADLHADHDRLVQELDEVSTRAVSTDPDDAFAWLARAYALSWQWRWRAALEANTKASSLDPFLVLPFAQRAMILSYTGQPAEALAWIDKAFALESQANQQVGYALFLRCRAYQAVGRYDDAIAACEKAVAQWEDYWGAHAYLVAAYTLKGDTARAEVEKMTLLKQQPGITIADLKAQRLSNDPAYLQQTETHLYAGLREAGIPEN